jgi:PilZ domain
MSILDGRPDLAASARRDKRTRKRWSINLSGKIFVPERSVEGDCKIVDLSPDGAGFKTACSAALGVRVVLYIDGFGRYEGTVVQRDRMRAGVHFACSDVKRAKIAVLIASFVDHGTLDATALRGTNRIRDTAALRNFKLSSGRSESCEVIDMALSGASLKTEARPDVGEEITFGSMTAVVMRHTELGIGVKFTGLRNPPTTAASV